VATFDAAAEHHYRLFTADRDAMQERLPEIVKTWCRQQVLMHLVAARRAIFYPDTPAPQQNGARLRQARSMYLDFPLPVTGKPLREATQADLVQAIGYYHERLKDADAKAKWLGLIADRIGNRAVGEALSEADLAALRETINA